jgi:hypothetical protein
MKQKIEDLKAFLATRKGKTAVGVVVLCGLVLAFAPGNKQNRSPFYRPKAAPEDVKTGKTKTDDMAQDIVTSFKSEVEELKRQNRASQDQIKKQQTQLQDYEQQTAAILKKMLDKMDDQNPGQGGAAPAPVELAQTAPAPEEEEVVEQFGMKEPEVGPPPTPTPRRVAFIGAGDSVRVKLLAGVNAPTDGTPYPVMLKLVSDVGGPDGSSIPLGEARVIAAAQGSLTDQRALFRLTTINVQLPSGEQKVIDVDGWIVGEDGIRGMPGVLIDPIGKAIAGSAFVGALSGFGNGLQMMNQQTFQNGQGGFTTQNLGSAAEAGGGGAAVGAAREWNTIIRDRLQNLTPHVQVLSGREATAVFARSFTVEGLYEALADQNANNGPGTLD